MAEKIQLMIKKIYSPVSSNETSGTSWTNYNCSMIGHSDQEDRAQREGLAQDLRQPVLPATTESDGVYRGTFEIDGTAQENVRIDEKYALEEGMRPRNILDVILY